VSVEGEGEMAKLYGIGTSVYLRNSDGDFLILKRAGGAARGSWYIPGGGLDSYLGWVSGF
jgi:8-oxo-dGTP pyrophosphatase MutT (NUDIX family)